MVQVMPQYEFIEIGTSNFDTLIQDCDDTVYGISIEPIQHYLDCLPNPKNVIKVCAAMSNEEGHLPFYYIKPSLIDKEKLPVWFKGCNSIGRRHPTVVNWLEQHDKNPDIYITNDLVKTLDFKTLIELYSRESINYLKIDTEGHDCVILKNYLEFCSRTDPTLYAKKIRFEMNELSNSIEQAETVLMLEKNGYSLLEYKEADGIFIRTI